MTRGVPMDPERTPRPGRPAPDVDVLAALVRDVADDWSLPPQRLDVLTWRDRVGRGHRAGDGGSGLRWTRRLLGAAVVAVVAIVSLSFAAVWLTAPRGDQGTVGSSPSPGGSPTSVPSGSAVPAVSPMPKLFRNGDLPTPSRIMVLTGRGYHIADLGTGVLGPVLIEKGYGPTTLLARPGGGWVCICGDGQNAIRLSVKTVDANGVVGEPRPIRDVVGTNDPKESDALQPQNAGVSVTASPDGRFALIGWVRRDGAAGWQIGADVLDLETLATVASTELLVDEPVAVDGRPRMRQAPIVRLSPGGDQILLASQSFVDNPSLATPNAGVDHWLASFDGRSIGALADAGATSSDVCLEFDAGLIGGDPPADDAVYYAACWTPTGPFMVKRIAADGRLVSATEVPGSLGGVDRGIRALPSGDAVFSWNPFDSVLSRLDLRSGELSVGEPQRPNRTGLTDRLGDLIVVTADGTRVYALGIVSSDPGGPGDSAGVYAFDAATLAPLGHWAPQANLTSIAVSDDGRHVYAAASGGPSAAGEPGPEFGASITAYDASDGSVALIAGRLGARDLTLGEAICR
jgi:hypothetical protein